MAVDTKWYLYYTADHFLNKRIFSLNENQVTNLHLIAERMEGKMWRLVVMRLVSSARLKIDIKDAIVLSYRILLNQQILSSKTKIILKNDD